MRLRKLVADLTLDKEMLSEVIKKRSNCRAGPGDDRLSGRNLKRPLSNKGMFRLMERMGHGDITVNDFRSTFRDWVEETTNYAGAVAEAALRHVAGDKVEAACHGDLFEKRRKLMAAWATYCTTPAKQSDVIPIRRGSAHSNTGRPA